MPNQILVPESPTPAEVVWADTTISVPDVTRTHQMNLTGLPTDTYRQGVKADLGALRAELYIAELRVEFATGPIAGQLVKVYFSWSRSATAGSLNPGGCSGADGTYTGTASGTAAQSVLQLDGPYALVATPDAVDTLIQSIGVVSAAARYVSPVIHNATGQSLQADAEEMYLALTPFVPEVQ